MSPSILLLAMVLGQDLEKPVRLLAQGKPIDAELGHLAPFFHDFDRDGKRDLLVGDFTGVLRFYKNLGTNESPRFGEAKLVQAGGTTAKVPTG